MEREQMHERERKQKEAETHQPDSDSDKGEVVEGRGFKRATGTTERMDMKKSLGIR